MDDTIGGKLDSVRAAVMSSVNLERMLFWSKSQDHIESLLNIASTKRGTTFQAEEVANPA